MAIFQALFVTKQKGLNALKMMEYTIRPRRILLILYQTLILSVVDYGYGLITLKLKVIRIQGMRTIFGCTRDASCEAMRHVLDLLSMLERHMRSQVLDYLKVVSGITSLMC